jgi:ketosteroid isomerase-like protein
MFAFLRSAKAEVNNNFFTSFLARSGPARQPADVFFFLFSKEVRMRGFRLFPAVVLLLLPAALPGQSSSGPAAGSDDAAVLKKLESEWIRAVREQDLPALEQVLSPDFTFTVAVAGRPLSTISRDAYIHRAKGYAVRESKFDETLARMYGDVAVVTSRYTQKAVLHGRDRSAEFLLTDTWVRLDGQWLAAARVSSRPEHPAT